MFKINDTCKCWFSIPVQSEKQRGNEWRGKRAAMKVNDSD